MILQTVSAICITLALALSPARADERLVIPVGTVIDAKLETTLTFADDGVSNPQAATFLVVDAPSCRVRAETIFDGWRFQVARSTARVQCDSNNGQREIAARLTVVGLDGYRGIRPSSEEVSPPPGQQDNIDSTSERVRIVAAAISAGTKVQIMLLQTADVTEFPELQRVKDRAIIN